MLLPEVWNIMSSTQYTIGFANQSEAYDFPVVVRKSLESAAAEYSNVNLIVRDGERLFTCFCDAGDELIEILFREIGGTDSGRSF